MVKKTKKQTSAPPSGWWNTVAEAPRSGLPDARKLNKRYAAMRRLLKANIVLTPVMILGSIMTMSTVLVDTPREAPQSEYTPTRAVAVQRVTSWLQSTPAPLPGGQLLAWERVETEQVPAQERGHEFDYDLEVHHITVTAANGALYDTSVTLANAPEIGTVVIGEPTLIPRAPSASRFNTSPWAGRESDGQAPAPVTTALQTWATAYASGDPESVRLAIQDTDPSRSYVPLVGGAQLGDVSINKVSEVWDEATDEERERSSGAPRLVVQASFAITWGSAQAPTGARVTYDLVVAKANTAAPHVTAWGAPGTGFDLQDYSNGVTGRSFTLKQDTSLSETDQEAPQ